MTSITKAEVVAAIGTAELPTVGPLTTLLNTKFGTIVEGAAVGVASGYKIARGIVTPTSASHTVVTGLTTVVAAVAVLQDAPDLTHMFTQADVGDQAGTPAAGSILVVSQKPTAAGDVTPIPSTTPWNAVAWIAVGT